MKIMKLNKLIHVLLYTSFLFWLDYKQNPI